MRFVKSAFVPLILAVMCAAPAAAVTYTNLPGSPDTGPAVGETILVDFNGAIPEGYDLTGDFAYATGTSGAAASPSPRRQPLPVHVVRDRQRQRHAVDLRPVVGQLLLGLDRQLQLGRRARCRWRDVAQPRRQRLLARQRRPERLDHQPAHLLHCRCRGSDHRGCASTLPAWPSRSTTLPAHWPTAAAVRRFRNRPAGR